MESDTGQPGLGTDAAPGTLKICPMLTGEGAHNDVRIVRSSLELLQDAGSLPSENDALGSCFGIGESQISIPHVFPFEGLDLTQPSTREDQQANGIDDR